MVFFFFLSKNSNYIKKILTFSKSFFEHLNYCEFKQNYETVKKFYNLRGNLK